MCIRDSNAGLYTMQAFTIASMSTFPELLFFEGQGTWESTLLFLFIPDASELIPANSLLPPFTPLSFLFIPDASEWFLLIPDYLPLPPCQSGWFLMLPNWFLRSPYYLPFILVERSSISWRGLDLCYWNKGQWVESHRIDLVFYFSINVPFTTIKLEC